jgi:hypothetical protein
VSALREIYPVDKVRVSGHAVERFRERTGCYGMNDWRIARFISSTVNEAILRDEVRPHAVSGQFLVDIHVVGERVVAVIAHDEVFPDNVFAMTVLTPAQAINTYPRR